MQAALPVPTSHPSAAWSVALTPLGTCVCRVPHFTALPSLPGYFLRTFQGRPRPGQSYPSYHCHHFWTHVHRICHRCKHGLRGPADSGRNPCSSIDIVWASKWSSLSTRLFGYKMSVKYSPRITVMITGSNVYNVLCTGNVQQMGANLLGT